MAGVNTRRSRREKFTITTVGATNWTTPMQVGQLGNSGVLDRVTVRGNQVGTVSVAVWYGDTYAQETAGLPGRSPAVTGGSGIEPTVTNPITDVLGEDHLIAPIVATATVADPAVLDHEVTGIGRVYDVRRNQRHGFVGEYMWVSVRLDAGPDQDLVVGLEAVDTL